jgi:hypothetical protein
MAAQLGQSIYINYEHMNDFDAALCTAVESEYYRYATNIFPFQCSPWSC